MLDLLLELTMVHFGVNEQGQINLSITRQLTKTARIPCKVSGVELNAAYIHWYRQKPGEALEWLLYFKSQSDKSNMDNRFSVVKVKTSETSICTLTIDNLKNDDTATYYCACWDLTVLESHCKSVQKLTRYSEPQTFKSMQPHPQKSQAAFLILPLI
uniref:Ig-like domain-containing protein n=1 Tax=Pelusios castaneus TaxID=367368 RepID=A0A8C8SUT3_9SAUR